MQHVDKTIIWSIIRLIPLNLWKISLIPLIWICIDYISDYDEFICCHLLIMPLCDVQHNLAYWSNSSYGLLKACVLYILRVGVTDQMMEPTQRSFLVFLGKQVSESESYGLQSFPFTFLGICNEKEFLYILDSFSLLMPVLPWKFLLYVPCPIHWKHWER